MPASTYDNSTNMEAHGTRPSESRMANGELSLAARMSIVSRAEPGTSKADLAREFGCAEKCIRDTIRRYNKTGTNQSKHRSGQPPKLTPEEKLYVCRIVQNTPKITNKELQRLCKSHFGKDVSEDTLSRALKEEGISISGVKRGPKADGAIAPRTPTILPEIPTPRPQPQKRRTQGTTHTLDRPTTLPRKRAHTAQQCKSPKRTRVSSQNSPTRLCDACQQIDFSAVLDLSWKDLQSAGWRGRGRLITKLGTRLHSVTTSCELCLALQWMMRVTPLTDKPHVQLRAYSTFSQAKNKTMRTLEQVPEELRARDLPHLAIVDSSRTDLNLDGPKRYAFCLSTSAKVGGIFTPRVPPPEVNFEEIKLWLACCKKIHSSLCNENGDEIRPSRLIDCKSVPVDIVEASQSMIYLALSYVWGEGSQRSNTPQNTPPSQSSNLPKTIQDAIHVTRGLGYRYLWVDECCIDQNSDEDKSSQIQIMDSIYREAELTIVAAAGEDKHFGLAGVSSRPRTQSRPPLYAGNFQIICTERHPRHLIQSSTWAGRAWTFQEAVLPRRLLYFTEHETYFECHAMQIRESLQANWEDLHSTHKRFWTNLHSGLFLGRLTCGNSSVRSTRQDLFGFYELVQQYTRRNMRNETDSLNAFQGIMQHLQKGSRPIYQIAGVPFVFQESPMETHKSFLVGLLWVHTSLSRTNTSPIQSCPELAKPVRRHFLPSWSWAGWKGGVHLAIRTNYKTEYPKLKVEAEITQVKVRGETDPISWPLMMHEGLEKALEKLPYALIIKTRLLRSDTYTIAFNKKRPLCRITSKSKQSEPQPDSRKGTTSPTLKHCRQIKGELNMLEGAESGWDVSDHFESNGLQIALLATHPGWSYTGRNNRARMYLMVLEPMDGVFTRAGFLTLEATFEDFVDDILFEQEERLIEIV